MERSNASGGSDIGERLATAAETSSAVPPPPPAESAADTRTRRGRHIVFGLLGLCALLVIALGALVFTQRQPPVKESSSPQASPRPEDGASPSLGFTDSLVDLGCQQYRPSGFSLGLPPLWVPYIKDIPNADPYLEWVATGYSDTSHQRLAVRVEGPGGVATRGGGDHVRATTAPGPCRSQRRSSFRDDRDTAV